MPKHERWCSAEYGTGPCECVAAPLLSALTIIRDIHADTGQPGASCTEGCGGRWPCSTYAEANHALTAR